MNSRVFLLVALPFLGASMPAQAGVFGAPYDDMQGMWYDMQHKVAVEVVGKELFIRELDTSDVSIKKQGWSVGMKVASYAGAEQKGEVFWFSGLCNSYASGGKLVPNCFDNATHYQRAGTKPFWALHAASLTLWRRDKFSAAEWSGRD